MVSSCIFFHLSSDNTTKIICCSTRRLLNTERKVRPSSGGFWCFSAFPCCQHLPEPSFVSFLGLQCFPSEGTTATQVQGHIPQSCMMFVSTTGSSCPAPLLVKQTSGLACVWTTQSQSTAQLWARVPVLSVLTSKGASGHPGAPWTPGRDQIQAGGLWLLANEAELFGRAESLLDVSPFPLPGQFPRGMSMKPDRGPQEHR